MSAIVIVSEISRDLLFGPRGIVKEGVRLRQRPGIPCAACEPVSFRLPSTRGRPASLAIEINPVGTSRSITKKRGVVIRSGSEL